MARMTSLITRTHPVLSMKVQEVLGLFVMTIKEGALTWMHTAVQGKPERDIRLRRLKTVTWCLLNQGTPINLRAVLVLLPSLWKLKLLYFNLVRVEMDWKSCANAKVKGSSPKEAEGPARAFSIL
ncbi:hypothetical protein O6P43_022944 [Quillaja saponaria]|uniref:Uncharacterized protein n=1 Tax=Quillaja saponaria TaxID=32244 RepID=A0AAD7LES7_QUISA|nr:hypothetical protein O6P43_022944 [Quillaja saponaria]